MYSNQESLKISPGIKPRHVDHFYIQKLCLEIRKLFKLVLVSSHVMFIRFSIKNLSLNQESPQISAGIKPHHVHHFYNQKLCLEIKKLLKLVLVSSLVMFIRFSIKNCVLKSTNSTIYCWYQAISYL